MKDWINLYYRCILEKLAMLHGYVYFVMFICLKVLMDLFFVVVVAEVYPYHYYQVHGNVLKYFLTWILLLVIFALMPRKENSVRDFFLHMQLIIMVMPMMTMYAFTEGKSTKYLLMVTISIIIECFILRPDGREYKIIKIKGLKPFVSVFLLIAIPICSILLINYGGFSGLSAFDLSQLYVIRQNASYPTILSYVSSWLTYIVIPFFTVYCFEKKRYGMAMLLIFDTLILYMVLAKKVIYLSLIVVLGVYLISKTGQLVNIMYMGISALLIAIIVMFLIDKSGGDVSAITIYPTALLGDRFLYGPALNKFLYYEIFSEYPKLYFSDGMIGRLMGLTNMYNYGPGQLVFGYVWNGRFGESNSCTGYLGDGYAQMGFWGIVILYYSVRRHWGERNLRVYSFKWEMCSMKI